MREKDDLDRLLDSALATYADPGPDAGLENRVLQALASERRAGQSPRAVARPSRWLVWGIAAPVAAIMLLSLSIANIHRAPSSRSPHVSQLARPSSPEPPNRPETSRRTEPTPSRGKSGGFKGHNSSLAAHAIPSTRASAALANPLPKLDVFPTPKPLTAEERALLDVAVNAPPQARQALVEVQQQSNEPLRIAAIHIPPLEPLSDSQP
jgi:hypothetical protein